MSTTSKQKFNKKMRLFVAQQGKCWLCGEPMEKPVFPAPSMLSGPMHTTIDHVVPRSKGGEKLNIDNWMLAHQRCNWERRDREDVRSVKFELQTGGKLR